MRSNLLMILFCYMCCAISYAAHPYKTKCSWRENFENEGKLDSTYWNYHIGTYPQGSEYYTDSLGNVFVKNGVLHIKATKDLRQGKICSSGRINTLGKQSFLYGKIEIKAKIPTGKGIFPAIWMLREDHPKTIPLGEIDIMEYIECYEKKQYSTTVHIVEKEPGKEEIRHKHYAEIEADMSRFHIYALEWTPESLVFKLDKKIVFTLLKAEAEFWPFDAPYYLILDVAYGSWGAKCGMDDSILPCEMLVDWIKYYELKQ